MSDWLSLDLASRAVQCPGWRWMPRMVTRSGKTVVGVDEDMPDAADDGPWYRAGNDTHPLIPPEERLPNLSAPATLGCLLALVREAWQAAGRNVLFDFSETLTSAFLTILIDGEPGWQGSAPDLAGVLVAALEVAP